MTVLGEIDQPVVTEGNAATVAGTWHAASERYGGFTPADKRAGGVAKRAYKWTSRIAAENREFVARAVTAAVRDGVEQIVDVGCGYASRLPTHEVVAELNPSCRTIYLDNDLSVTKAARLNWCRGNETTVTAAYADLRQIDTIVRGIDHGLRTVFILGLVLEWMEWDEAREAMEGLRLAAPEGSRLIVSHSESTARTRAAATALEMHGLHFRPREVTEVRKLCRVAGQIQTPGLKRCGTWRVKPEGRTAPAFAAVVRVGAR